jgi:hypothetical protein
MSHREDINTMTTELVRVGDTIRLTADITSELRAGAELVVRRIDPEDVEGYPIVADMLDGELRGVPLTRSEFDVAHYIEGGQR